MSLLRYRVVSQYRRTVSAIPSQKRLIAVKDIKDQPIPFGAELGQLCRDVIFSALDDDAGAHYWAKRWLNDRAPLLGLTQRIESFLATLGRTDLCLAVDVSPEFGLVYHFDDELFSSTAVVHQWDCKWYFNAGEREAVQQFAASTVVWTGLPQTFIGVLTDFQVTKTTRGLVFLDFEPSQRYAAELAGVQIP